MARIIALSSLVARGHVGLAAYRPVLEALGHEVTALPTVVLSNHPGHAHAAGFRIEPEALARMIDALDANGWLAEADVVLTGYLPSAAHVHLAASLIDRVRASRPDLRVIVDPVLGDDPKGLYIDADAAAAIRDVLIGRADVATPNRFELSWMSGRPVTNVGEAVQAARICGRPMAIATSIPAEHGQLATLSIDREGARACFVRQRYGVANGTGDVIAALIAAGYPLGRAVATVGALIETSAGQSELALVAGLGHALATAALDEIALT